MCNPLGFNPDFHKVERKKGRTEEMIEGRSNKRRGREKVGKWKGQRDGGRKVKREKKTWLAFIHDLFKFITAKSSEAEDSRKANLSGPTFQLF